MDIEQLTQEILDSANYGQVDPIFVRRVAETEAAKGRSYKETVKAVKNKLHQVGGAYFPGKVDYAKFVGLMEASEGDPLLLKDACRTVLSAHASTRERLPLLERFYSEILSGLPTPTSVLDLACGLNPLAYPWMGLPASTRYTAYDIYADMISFIGRFFKIAGINGSAHTASVIESPPEERTDLAFLLKAIPCLEQVDKTAGKRLLESLKVVRLVVSFPAKSLGGRSKGMVENYEAHFHELLQPGQTIERRIEFSNELVFVVFNGD